MAQQSNQTTVPPKNSQMERMDTETYHDPSAVAIDIAENLAEILTKDEKKAIPIYKG